MSTPFTVASVTWGEGSSEFILTDQQNRKLKFAVEGDCCSHSYFDDNCREDVLVLVGQTLRKVDTVQTRSENHGEEKFYMTTLTTDKGHTTLSWRNDSNGYYSGYLILIPGGGEIRYPPTYAADMEQLGIETSSDW